MDFKQTRVTIKSIRNNSEELMMWMTAIEPQALTRNSFPKKSIATRRNYLKTTLRDFFRKITLLM